MLKKTSLFLSISYTLVLSALSLIKLNIEAPNLPSYKDKIGHALAHFIFVIIWFVVFRFRLDYKYNRAVAFAALFSVVYGFLIELLQGWVTLSRQSDLNDVAANIIGMVFAVLLLFSIKKWVLKNNNTLLF